MTAAQGGDLGGVVREERRPCDRAERKRSLGTVEGGACPGPREQDGRDALRQRLPSPASRAQARSRARSASVRGSGMTSAEASGSDPAERGRSLVPHQLADEPPGLNRGRAPRSAPEALPVLPVQAVEGRRARWPWRPPRAAPSRSRPGLEGHLDDPLDAVRHHLVPRRPLVQRQPVGEHGRGVDLAELRAPAAPGSSACRVRGRRW